MLAGEDTRTLAERIRIFHPSDADIPALIKGFPIQKDRPQVTVFIAAKKYIRIKGNFVDQEHLTCQNGIFFPVTLPA